MRSRASRLRAVVVLGFASASFAVAAMASATSTDPYQDSGFYAPYDGSGELGYPEGEVGGEFHYQPYDTEAPDPETTSTSAVVPEGGYIDEVEVSVALDDPASVPDACPAEIGADSFSFGPEDAPSPGEGQVAAFVMPATFTCNGRYTAVATAHVEQPGENPASKQVISTFIAAIPPPAVTGVTAALGGNHRVNIAWDAAIAPAPDFVGYSVWRRVGDGTYVRLASITDLGATTYTDDRVPVQGGELTYRVLGVRSAPGGFVRSADASATLSVAGLPTSTTRPGARPRTGRGGLSLAPPTTEDTGFSEELPYEQPDPTDDPAGDDLASVLYEDESQPKGLLVPAAIASVMFAWAIHLRYLARRAAQPL